MTDNVSEPGRVPLYRNADFARLLTAQCFSITGREIESLVLPLLVLALTGSPAQAGLMGAAQTLPYVALSLPAGGLVDRWNRKTVLIVCEIIRAASFASLPIAWFLGVLGLIQLYVVSVAAGSAFVFSNIAEVSALPQFVEREALPRAASINLAVEWTGENAGPAIGGALMSLGRTSTAGAMLAYATQAAMLLVSGIVLGTIKRSMRIERATAEQRHLAAEIADGVRWLISHPTLRLMTLLGLATNVVFSPIMLVLIVRARDGFHASPFIIGLMFSVGGGAGFIATILAPSLKQRVRVGAVLVACAWTWAAGLLALAAAPSMLVLTLAWMIVPAVAGVQEVVGLSYRLSLIPADLQGRVNSVVRFVVWGLRPASLALAGFFTAGFGARDALWIMAALMGVTALAALKLWNAR